MGDITPAMAMRVTGILWTMLDSNKQPFDGARTYKVTLPKDIPQANFWSFTLYDNMSRSMPDMPQRYPRAGSQSYPIGPTPGGDRCSEGLMSASLWRVSASAGPVCEICYLRPTRAGRGPRGLPLDLNVGPSRPTDER